ncbi:MAG: transporter [Ferruginibacter sp.]
MKKVCVFFLIISNISDSFSQVSRFETDRPGLSFSPFTTPKNWVQLEAGFSREASKEGGNYGYELPQLLTKYGLHKNLEFRLLTTYGRDVSISSNATSRDGGLSNLEAGFKWKFLKQQHIVPHTALIVQYISRGLNTRPFRDSVDGLFIRLAMQHNFSPHFSMKYNLGINWSRFNLDRIYMYSVSPRFHFAENWMVYVEAFVNVWDKRKPRHILNGGASYLINDRLQLDASYGRKINEFSPTNIISIGGSFRFETNSASNN